MIILKFYNFIHIIIEIRNYVVKFSLFFYFYRRASVALNVWQPDIIRGRQKQLVEQCAVPVESRIRTLEMEHKLCKQQISVFDKAYVSVHFIPSLYAS